MPCLHAFQVTLPLIRVPPCSDDAGKVEAAAKAAAKLSAMAANPFVVKAVKTAVATSPDVDDD